MNNHCCRVVLTGGPGGGKTTAADLYRREIGEGVVIVPEAATLLYTGGFPRRGPEEVMQATQRAIYHVQKNLEDAHYANYRHRVLLCDRGTVDGAAYWPGEPADFFSHLGTTLEDELSRYDAVIFFETAAVGGISIEGGNPTRTESLEAARTLDQRLRSLWEKHPNFVLVPHNASFLRKVNSGLAELEKFVTRYHNGGGNRPGAPAARLPFG